MVIRSLFSSSPHPRDATQSRIPSLPDARDRTRRRPERPELLIAPGGYWCMEIHSESPTAACPHCKREIPAPNFDLHYAHCSRNLERCSICGDMIPKRHANEHYYNTHAPVDCSLCSETIERNFLDLHKGEKCPQRIVTCEYCEFPLPAIDLSKHQEVCGNRTEYCNICHKYVRLRERAVHDVQFHENSTTVGESSRNGSIREEENPHRRRPRAGQHDLSKRRLLFTIAITGIAILIGSIFFKRKPEAQQ